MFYKGQKVVCINDDPCPCHGHFGGVKKDGIYTVSGTWFYGLGRHRILAISLAEPTVDIPGHHGFWSERFRPAVEKKSGTKAGMEVLHDILARESGPSAAGRVLRISPRTPSAKEKI